MLRYVRLIIYTEVSIKILGTKWIAIQVFSNGTPIQKLWILFSGVIRILSTLKISLILFTLAVCNQKILKTVVKIVVNFSFEPI